MKHKWTPFCFWTGDFKAVERYLNEQAARGWELEKTRIIGRWKRTDRQDLTYCVDLANPRDDENDRKAYADFCAEGGWTQVGFVNRMHIFKSLPGRDAIPIQTDSELEIKNYKMYYIRQLVLTLLLTLVSGALNGVRLSLLAERAEEGQIILWPVTGLVLLLLLLFVWRLVDLIRAAVGARQGAIPVSPRWVMWTNYVTAILILPVLIFLTIAFLCR